MKRGIVTIHYFFSNYRGRRHPPYQGKPLVPTKSLLFGYPLTTYTAASIAVAAVGTLLYLSNKMK